MSNMVFQQNFASAHNSLDALKCELIKSWDSLDPDYMWRTINSKVPASKKQVEI